ncbi:hypothetical protein KXW38_001136, partial [Aspergillus fumigatus]
EEGRIAIVTNAGRMAVDAGFIVAIFGPAWRLSRERDLRAQRAMKPAYGKIVWSRRPRYCASSLREDCNAPRGEHDISRQTIAQGRPRVRLHLYAAVRFFLRVQFAQRTAGAGRHPVFPAPSWLKRARLEQASGEQRREMNFA